MTASELSLYWIYQYPSSPASMFYAPKQTYNELLIGGQTYPKLMAIVHKLKLSSMLSFLLDMPVEQVLKCVSTG